VEWIEIGSGLLWHSDESWACVLTRPLLGSV